MDIKRFVDLELLQQIQDLFSDATGLAAIAVDAQGQYITKGSNFTDFCMKYTRGSQEGAQRCIRCDTECTGTYYCHAGLMDFASNIVVEGERVGAIIGGQVLPHEPDLEKFREIARELHIEEDAYIEALKKVPIRSEKMIRSAADMLSTVVNQLVNMEYIKKRDAKRVEISDKEIKNALQAIAHVKSQMHDLERVALMENILSLNASVEAARAGSAGVGFAVVAREIGELSRNSSSVYQKITEMVSAIEQSINEIDQVHV